MSQIWLIKLILINQNQFRRFLFSFKAQIPSCWPFFRMPVINLISGFYAIFSILMSSSVPNLIIHVYTTQRLTQQSLADVMLYKRPKSKYTLFDVIRLDLCDKSGVTTLIMISFVLNITTEFDQLFAYQLCALNGCFNGTFSGDIRRQMWSIKYIVIEY